MPNKNAAFVEMLKENGWTYTAKYMEIFDDGGNPWFANGRMNKEAQEQFYKKCVEEGHPWDYYEEAPPDDAIF